MQVLSHGNFTGNHPVNRKAKCTVYLRDLQEQTSLTDEALQLVARVCGPRYCLSSTHVHWQLACVHFVLAAGVMSC